MERKAAKAERRRKKAATGSITELPAAVSTAADGNGAAAGPAAGPAAAAAAVAPAPARQTPVAFTFPGQGSQAVGMLKV